MSNDNTEPLTIDLTDNPISRVQSRVVPARAVRPTATATLRAAGRRPVTRVFDGEADGGGQAVAVVIGDVQGDLLLLTRCAGAQPFQRDLQVLCRLH